MLEPNSVWPRSDIHKKPVSLCLSLPHGLRVKSKKRVNQGMGRRVLEEKKRFPKTPHKWRQDVPGLYVMLLHAMRLSVPLASLPNARESEEQIRWAAPTGGFHPERPWNDWLAWIAPCSGGLKRKPPRPPPCQPLGLRVTGDSLALL